MTDYQGHSTSLDVLTVTDENGARRTYELETDDEGFTVLTIAVPEGQFVHGEQTYVIEYTQTDVTSTATDLSDGVTRDEFYWDTNGIGWLQPFREVSATVQVARDLIPALTGESACYFGFEGSTDRCTIAGVGDGAFEASVSDLQPGQNMTVVVSFTPGTFAGAPFWAYVPILAIVAFALVLFGLIFALVIRFVRWRDAPGRGIVVAQYEPAEGMSALLAANIVGQKKKGMAAALVDLAVRRKLRILEQGGGSATLFGVERLSDDGLGPDEQRVMSALFSLTPFALPGRRSRFTRTGLTPPPVTDPANPRVRWLSTGDTVLGQQVVALTKTVAQETEASGLRRKPSRGPFLVMLAAMVLAGILLLIQTIGGGGGETSIVLGVLGLNLVPWVAIFAGAMLLTRRPLTTRGSELKEHLEGLREFIRVAEADRLQMLQSVSGAERISAGDGTAIVKIYERLLPYAVLFGLEKEWAQEIARYYDTTEPPDWYSGSNGFAIGAFAAGIGSLSSSVSTSYSGSSGSSSSGGGGGGGSSGGGGGGGGGGGV